MHDQSDPVLKELDLLLQIGVDKLLAGASLEALREWFSAAAPHLAPGWIGQFGTDPGLLRALGLQIARLLWTRLPDPELGFGHRRLAKPERNAPCPCGSGRKYKQCCSGAPDLAAALGDFSLLPYVLNRQSAKQLKQVPFRRFDPGEIAAAADSLCEHGRERHAEALLDAFFASGPTLDLRVEPAFDLAMNLYLDHDRPRKRKRLLGQILAAPDRLLRAVGLQRQATMLIDAGDHDGAWHAFTDAQRLDPDHPALGILEVSLLSAEGRMAEAGARAEFWAARLAREDPEGYGALIAQLRRTAADPAAGLFEFHAAGNPALETLRGLIETPPQPAARYRLSPQAGDAGPLRPTGEATRLIGEWQARFPDPERRDPWAQTDWVDWLADHPAAWDLFEVLFDLWQALGDSPLPPALAEPLELGLLERADELLRLVLAESHAADCTLAWGWLENRAALTLVGQLAVELQSDAPERAAALMAWLVTTLNPDDNQGLRIPLIHLYVRIGAIDKAVALGNRYADDLAAMRYGRVLALYTAGERGRALSVLADARRGYPKVLKMLLAANPRVPKLHAYGITVGGDDEAWLYRASYRELWRQTGAFDWARDAARALR